MFNFIVSCEHNSNRVPQNYNGKKIPIKLLSTHRAYDIGAEFITKKLGKKLSVPVVFSNICRLVIDFNRSSHNPKIWSSYSRTISQNQKDKLLELHRKHREKIESQIDSSKENIHFSIHSFTPQLNSEIRKNQIGILYDTRRKKECFYADRLASYFKKSGISIRKNYPYIGRSDGICTPFRKIHSNYIGLEIEINQNFILSKEARDLIPKILTSFCDDLKFTDL